MSLIGRWIAYKAWTPAMFAKRAGISLTTVSKLTQEGVRHQETTIRKYAPIFGVSFEEFLAGPPAMSKEEVLQKYGRARHAQKMEEAGEEPVDYLGILAKRGLSSDDMLRAKAMKIICALPAERLERAIGYLEGLIEETRKSRSQQAS